MTKKLELLIMTLYFLLLSGCGLTGNNDVPPKQIAADIERQPLKVKRSNGIGGYGTSEWDFNPRAFKPLSCFAVNRNESKITASNAELLVTVASWQKGNRLDSDTMIETWYYNTLYGKVLMRYKKEGDKWILENAEPQDFTWENPKSSETFEEFVQRAMPLCAQSGSRK